MRKAIRTPRYRHLIYTRDYGSELEELVGKGYDRSLQESEIQRMVTETLLADARTESVDQFLLPGKEKFAVSAAALRASGMKRKL